MNQTTTVKTVATLIFFLCIMNPLLVAASSVITPADVEIPRLHTRYNKNKKLNVFQKAGYKFLQKKIQKKLDRLSVNNKQKSQGRISMILGLLSFAFLFVPYGLWLALPVAVIALIFGIKSVKGNNNIEGIVGLVASGITLSLYLIVGIVMMTVAFATGF